MPVYLLQQAERRTEYQKDIEKKKQELYAEIDSFQIKDKTQVNTLKKFLSDREIWSLQDMDYPLRISYEGYLKEKRNSNSVSLDENEQLYYEISSKVEKYQDAEKSGEFLLFLMAFVIGLIIMAAFLLIHSCIQTEKEENSRAVCSLRLLGMTDKEIVKCLCYKNFLRFIPPAVMGTILSFLPSYYLNESYGMGANGILAGIVFGVILAIGIFVVIRRYSEKEVKIY